MRVLISADMEGCTGVATWGQCGGPAIAKHDWEFARRMMTHDVNSAIRGAHTAGAAHVVVKDSHGSGKNLLVDELEPGTELISGNCWMEDGMVQGVAEDHAAAVLVGYHARAGTPHAVMEHTMVDGVHRLWVNGTEAGEIYLAIATCASRGVPVVAIVSDAAGCHEAKELVPSIHAAVTKHGMGRYLARLLHPDSTGRLIRDQVRDGVLAATRPSFEVGAKQEIKLETKSTEQADAIAEIEGWKRSDGYTLTSEWPDWSVAHSQLLVTFQVLASSWTRG
ncbi:MAG: M55 family metallopeptidase [Fimbriimonadaceae bacterium]|nr:M55 family metallopeptidase [Fimbriimonadaceae bacterium]